MLNVNTDLLFESPLFEVLVKPICILSPYNHQLNVSYSWKVETGTFLSDHKYPHVHVYTHGVPSLHEYPHPYADAIFTCCCTVNDIPLIVNLICAIMCSTELIALCRNKSLLLIFVLK
jgi:hypothetical protein